MIRHCIFSYNLQCTLIGQHLTCKSSTITSSQKKLEDFTFIVQYMDLCQDPLRHVFCNSVLKGMGFMHKENKVQCEGIILCVVKPHFKYFNIIHKSELHCNYTEGKLQGVIVYSESHL